MILNIIIYLLIIIGVFFVISGIIGIFRMKDIFCRLQASTNIATLGGMSLILAASLYGIKVSETSIFMKGLIMILFLLITNPVTSHKMARASYKIKCTLCKETVMDEYRGKE